MVHILYLIKYPHKFPWSTILFPNSVLLVRHLQLTKTPIRSLPCFLVGEHLPRVLNPKHHLLKSNPIQRLGFMEGMCSRNYMANLFRGGAQNIGMKAKKEKKGDGILG